MATAIIAAPENRVTPAAMAGCARSAFEQQVADIPQVLHVQRLFGDPDYLLRVVARDLPAYTQLYDEHLAALPGVLRLNSTLVMKSIVDARPLPL